MITQVSSLQHESCRDANFVVIGGSIRCPYRTIKQKVVMMPTLSPLTVRFYILYQATLFEPHVLWMQFKTVLCLQYAKPVKVTNPGNEFTKTK